MEKLLSLQPMWAAALLLLSTACGAAATDAATPPGAGDIASVHHRKCGKCHARPEPHSRERETLVAVFARHRSRAHLTADQWEAMIDFMSTPGADGGAAPAPAAP
jgi:hypothetical protein